MPFRRGAAVMCFPDSFLVVPTLAGQDGGDVFGRDAMQVEVDLPGRLPRCYSGSAAGTAAAHTGQRRRPLTVRVPDRPARW
jgi:hypothetical protein